MTMSSENNMSDVDLEGLFEAARECAPVPSDSLWAQVHADSITQMPEAAGVTKGRSYTGSHKGILAGLLGAIGGWSSVAGLTAATLTGVWIGFASPDAIDGLSQIGLLPGISASESYELEDLMPGIDGFSTLLEDG